MKHRNFRLTAVFTAILLLCACLLSGCGCADAHRGAQEESVPGSAEQETVPPLPSCYRWYTYENCAFAAPEDSFRAFTSGDAKNVLSLTGGDGEAQVYLCQCRPEDTGTDKTYFDRLTAAAYGELYCDLGSISDYSPVGTPGAARAAFTYTVPGESDETTSVFRLFFVKDSAHGCVWLLRCRCTAASADSWVSLFDDMSRFVRTDADACVPAV